jgi:hypothetical protein
MDDALRHYTYQLDECGEVNQLRTERAGRAAKMLETAFNALLVE